MDYQLLEYSCSECGMLLKETMRELNQDLFIISSVKEECPKCGFIPKVLKRVCKQPPQIKELYYKENNRRSIAALSPVPSPISKFQIAYNEFISRLMFDIEDLDTSLQNLNNNDNYTLAIIGNNNYDIYNRKITHSLLNRLCVYTLFVRQEKCFNLLPTSSSPLRLLPYVIIVDAGNSIDFYQFTEFIRQYGLDIKKTLQRIVVSRAFTVYQLTNLIIKELPNFIRQLDTCLIIVPDLLNMFTHDPNIDHKEAKHLIQEIISAIRKIATRTRCAISWNYNHESSSYMKTLLPKFDKCIEVASLGEKQMASTFSLKIYEGRSSRYCKSSSTSHCLLDTRDLYFIPKNIYK